MSTAPGNMALCSITTDDLRAWLAEYGLNLRDVTEAVIRLDRREHGRIGVWLDATWFLRDVDGHFFRGETGDAATSTASIPIRSWPPLTEGRQT